MWSIITWKSHLSPRRITLRPRWHPPSPVKGPSIGNPPTFIGGARCTFVTWPNTEQDRHQCSRPPLAFKLLHLCSGPDGQAGATQSFTLSPPTLWKSRVLCVTSVSLSARASQTLHRSFAPMGVPASFGRVNCSAQCSQLAGPAGYRHRHLSSQNSCSSTTCFDGIACPSGLVTAGVFRQHQAVGRRIIKVIGCRVEAWKP